jgi:tetratricopeptide (TPR) repeat protein
MNEHILGLTPIGLAVFAFYFSFLLTRLWWYMPSYLNDYWHMLYNICEDKPAHYPWCELAMKYFADNNYTAAFTMWMEALHRSPKDFKPLFNVSTMLLVMGRVDEARARLKEAEDNMYDGVSDTWVKEFIAHNYALLDKVQKEGKIRVDEIKVIK